MNVNDAIRSNRAIRDFLPDSISEARLLTILEAGRQTQSAKNLQPWHFIVIRTRETLDALADLMKGDIDEQRMRRARIAVAIVGDPSSEFMLFDLGRLVQNMSLSAWELGIGSTVVSGPEAPERESYRRKAGRLLGVPKNLKFQELMVFGRPRFVPSGHKKRKELDDIVSYEKFR